MKKTLLIIFTVFILIGIFYFFEKPQPQEESLIFGQIEPLNTKYISGQVWPPQIVVSEEANLICEETPKESSFSLRTYKEVFNNQEYCITASSEGAAGSIYTEYSYTTLKFKKLIRLDFVLRFNNCANYEEVENLACTQERESFNPTKYIDKIISEALISWKEVENLITSCEIESAWQTHSKEVSVTLKDGTNFRSIEPEIDDLFKVVEASKSKCGEVLVGTE